GSMQDLTATTVSVNGVPALVDSTGAFAVVIGLAEGQNFITIAATDAAGNSQNAVRQVTRDATPPLLTITEPADGASVEADSVRASGSVSDASAVTVSARSSPLMVSIPLAVGADSSFSRSVPLAVG